MESTKHRDLLIKFATKPVRRFIQFDYFWDTPENEVLKIGSGRKKFLCYRAVDDLRNTDCIRLQFPPGIKQSEVLLALNRFRKNLKNPDVWNFLIEDAKKLS